MGGAEGLVPFLNLFCLVVDVLFIARFVIGTPPFVELAIHAEVYCESAIISSTTLWVSGGNGILDLSPNSYGGMHHTVMLFIMMQDM